MAKSRNPRDRGARILVKVFHRGLKRMNAQGKPLTTALILDALRTGGLPVLPIISEEELDREIERVFGPKPEQLALGFDPVSA